jgi:hypothetical protein
MNRVNRVNRMNRMNRMNRKVGLLVNPDFIYTLRRGDTIWNWNARCSGVKVFIVVH